MDCVSMEQNMLLRPGIDKRPWQSAKFWHGDLDEMKKAPCDMTPMKG